MTALEKQTTMTTTTNRLRIVMSETAPVCIDPTVWRKIALAKRHDGAVECQANTEWFIAVREHEDGRRLVYGVQDAGGGGQYAGYCTKRAGYLVKIAGVGGEGCAYAARFKTREEETIRAIRRVAGVIEDDQLADECIGDLPATEL